MECCTHSLACLFLTDARRSSANTMYDRQKRTCGTLQAASSTALCYPANSFPVNRSTTGGHPVKHGVCKGGSCTHRQKATTKRDHTLPVLPVTGARAASGRAAVGMPLADHFSGFTGMRADGEPFSWSSSNRFLVGKTEFFPPFLAAVSQLAASALKSQPHACSAGI